jgi:hypothetical protein
MEFSSYIYNKDSVVSKLKNIVNEKIVKDEKNID